MSAENESFLAPTETDEQPDDPPRPAEGSSSKRMTGGTFDILSATTIVCLPLIAISLLLIGIVFLFRVQSGQLSTSQLGVLSAASLDPVQTDPTAYYVRISATTVVLLASFSSSVAISVVSFLMMLLSYPVSRQLLRLSEIRRLNSLPSPYQLSLLIMTLNGGINTLWCWMKYFLGWRGSLKVGRVVILSESSLSLSCLLVTMILAADIWLHVATTTVSYVQLLSSVPPTMSFGRGMSPSCLASYSEFRLHEFPGDLPCSLKIAATAIYIVEGNEGYQTANNLSAVNQLFTVYQDGIPYVLLGDVSASALSVDFSASTIAVNTECTPISAACNLTSHGAASTSFNCSKGFAGDLALDPQACTASGGWIISFFNDSALTELANYGYPVNPIYFGMATVVNVNGHVGQLNNDSDIVVVENGGDAFVLQCTTTVYDVSYDFINGSIANLTEIQLANVSFANIVNAPQQATQYALNVLENGAMRAGFSNTSQELADTMALVYSQTSLGFAAGVFSPRNNLEEQFRNTFLVAKIPFRPFYLLVVLNLLYATAGLIMGIVALWAQEYAGVREIQSRLTISGLVSQCLEPPVVEVQHMSDRFEERYGNRLNVVGMEKLPDSVNEWRYQVWKLD